MRHGKIGFWGIKQFIFYTQRKYAGGYLLVIGIVVYQQLIKITINFTSQVVWQIH